MYSPFYLRHHPNERSQNDIASIQSMSIAKGQNELEGVENVFEKNLVGFEHLIKGAHEATADTPKGLSDAQPPQSPDNTMVATTES